MAPRAAAVRTTTAPAIDGRLDDTAWNGAPVISLFVQRDPDEGVPASEATEVRIAYDDEAMYVAARMHDRGRVTSRLGRRDMTTSSSDWFRVSLDSYYDRRSAFRFEVNPDGVRRDSAISGGGGNAGADGDLAWDAVWDAAATIDADGWTAEMRIPFSQLRFTAADEQTWGLQLERVIDRRQELSMFSFTPKSEQGGVPAFGDLDGSARHSSRTPARAAALRAEPGHVPAGRRRIRSWANARWRLPPDSTPATASRRTSR